jgi:hypothetical protein
MQLRESPREKAKRAVLRSGRGLDKHAVKKSDSRRGLQSYAKSLDHGVLVKA